MKKISHIQYLSYPVSCYRRYAESESRNGMSLRDRLIERVERERNAKYLAIEKKKKKSPSQKIVEQSTGCVSVRNERRSSQKSKNVERCHLYTQSAWLLAVTSRAQAFFTIMRNIVYRRSRRHQACLDFRFLVDETE